MNLNFNKNIDNFSKNKNIKSILLNGERPIKNPKYSIVIPTHKRSHLLKQAIDSALSQTTREEFEVIVVDDEAVFGQNTNTEKLIMNYSDNRLHYYKNEINLGMVGNWNRCFELASGDYVTILHDDDWLETEYLEKCNERFCGDKALYFRTKWVDSRNKKYSPKKVNIILKKIIHSITPKKHNLTAFSCFITVLSTNGVLYKKCNFVKLGGFDENHYPGADYTFNSKYILNYGGLYYKLCLSNYRIGENESLDCSKLFPKLIYEVRKELIKYIKYNKKLLHIIIDLLYDYDVIGTEKQWNVKVENDLVINKYQKCNILYKFKMAILRKYILFYKVLYLL
jgi:glycosyltransferase involved in cell wall biosynthesis